MKKKAKELGLLTDSRTYRRYLAGEITEQKARYIGRYMRKRHLYTNYEELLRDGWSREEARAASGQELRRRKRT